MPKPDIGLSMLFCLEEPFSSLVKHLYEVDVCHVELVDEGLHTLNSRRVKTLKKVAHSRDLKLVVHAPFMNVNIASPSSVLQQTVLRRLEKSILYAHQLDCQLWVFHPGLKTSDSKSNPELDWQTNLQAVRALLRIARKYGVEAAIENVPELYHFLVTSVQDFFRFYEELGEDLGLVFDVAHANLDHQIQDFIRQFPNKIVHMHVSDNDGARDMHLGIRYGNIDWESVAKAIRKAEYDKVIMLESIEHVEESLQTLRKLFT